MKAVPPPVSSSNSAAIQRPLSETSDAAAGTTTSHSIALNETFDGSLDASDHDWIEITLDANVDYIFSLWGTGGSAVGLADPILALRDSAGNLLQEVDDTGDTLFSMIEFKPATSGTFYLDVSGYSTSAGRYSLSATTNVLTPTQIATFETEFFWGHTAPIHFDVVAGDTLTYNIQNLNADGRQLAEWALESWSDVTGIVFRSTTASDADLRFDDSQPGAFAGPSSFDPRTGHINYSEINVSTEWLSYGTTLDSHTFLTYLHEIGHALGLGHAGHYNGSADFGVSNHYLNDSYQTTIMSYFSQTENTYVSGDYALPITPMIADVIAAQMLYGTAAQSNHGDTTWFSESTVEGYLGDVLNAVFSDQAIAPSMYQGDDVAFTIFDTGGTDHVNLGTSNENLDIDLAPGASTGLFRGNGNIRIAENTWLEAVTTGTGNDTLTGNDIANRLTGGDGSDNISGGLGSDTLYGGEGADTLDGGFTHDFLYGGLGNDSLLGNTSYDNLDGGEGADTMRGGTGADTLYGGAGNDSMLGNTGVDYLYGGAGDDWISPGNGVDVAYGEDGNDTILGRTGWDSIYGGTGDDVLYGSEGIDLLHGGEDNDYLSGGTGNDLLHGDSGDDMVYGNQGNDSLTGAEGQDSLYGATGDDTLRGGDGADLIYAAQGRDLLEGGAGNDTLAGGTLADTFIFGRGDGHDLLLNFQAHEDVIELHDGICGPATTGAEVIATFGSIVDGRRVLHFDNDLSITFDEDSDFESWETSLLVIV